MKTIPNYDLIKSDIYSIGVSFFKIIELLKN